MSKVTQNRPKWHIHPVILTIYKNHPSPFKRRQLFDLSSPQGVSAVLSKTFWELFLKTQYFVLHSTKYHLIFGS